MIYAELGKQLMIYVDNKVGTLAQLTSIISASGINLVAICAYAVETRVAIMFVTEDNNEAKRLLEKQHYVVQEEEVILLTIGNKPGALQHVTDKIAEAGIDLRLAYGSVDKKAQTCCIILITDNNLDAMALIKTQLERG